MRTMLLATTNRGKLTEIQRKWADLPVAWCTLADFEETPEVEEDGATFEANARKKAVAYARWSNLPTLADDSGLEVDALQGAPGVYSSRFAGQDASDADRNALLLHRLLGVPPARRTARFVCVMAFALPDGACWSAGGVVEGVIADVPRGSGGFGYDPIFHLPHLDRRMAELSPDEKNTLSHRGRALDAIRPLVEAWLKVAE